MASIYDYLFWRGDISLEEHPFNDADNVVMATLSYLDFDDIVPGPQEDALAEDARDAGISLRKASKALLRQSQGNLDSFVRSFSQIEPRFLELLANADRYAGTMLHSYVDVIDDERDMQFAALQIDLPNNETYVSFRGTDNSLVGWREDFMVSFEVTEAQRRALSYLEDALRLAQRRGRKVRVGGHSKGGNLAEYASVCCADELRDLIVCVYSNDGPGMAPEVMPADERAVLGSRIRRIVPTYSVVGMIFAADDDKRTIVPSSSVGIAQHDTMSWKFSRTGMKEAPDLLPDCVALNKAIAKWAKGLPLQERERITNELFDALESGGANTFEEIVSSKENLSKVLEALKSTDRRTRDMVDALLFEAIENSVDMAKKMTQETFDLLKKKAGEAAEDALRSFFNNAIRKP